MKKLKIALVSDWFYPKKGGIEYSVYSLARALLARGHRVHIITREYAESPEVEGLSVHRVKGEPLPLQERFLEPVAYRELYHRLRLEGYDLVHVHGLDSPLAMASLIAGKSLGMPTVATNHSLVDGGLMKYLHLALGRLFLQFARGIIAVSSAVAEETRVMAPERKVYIIPNGIEGKTIENSFARGERIIVTTVARMTRKKGVEEVVGIAPRLLERNPRLFFQLVGDGPLREKLEAQVKEEGMADKFHFTGELPRGEVLERLEDSDIFFLPSEKEAFGISVLEALSKGVPPVARNHSGVSDIVKHGQNGYLGGDRGELEGYLEKLIESPELRASLSASALGEAPRYRWSRVVERVEEVYVEVMGRKKGLLPVNSHPSS